VRLDLQLGVELVRGAGFLGIDLFHPRFIAAEADVLAAQRTAIEPQRGAGEPFEERAVVADDHERAGIALEPGFQPVDRGEIEVVGRFVQQQDVGV
jgi:hypothetical protein